VRLAPTAELSLADRDPTTERLGAALLEPRNQALMCTLRMEGVSLQACLVKQEPTLMRERLLPMFGRSLGAMRSFARKGF